MHQQLASLAMLAALTACGGGDGETAGCGGVDIGVTGARKDGGGENASGGGVLVDGGEAVGVIAGDCWCTVRII